ncbi:MAG TPA: helix-turn-helix transcriptional regulator [Candidatus Dormibacteraeota bacterium]|jgi:transcriptional regulator with XRE-family HTH domain|nr:helix-turn-helix transcriptional regulator [Candidatus Dormibacteraeota bacterium]
MRITHGAPDGAVAEEVGARIARTRLERNLTQADLAARAGVGKTTVQRLEGGETTTLANFIRILRALELLDGVDRLIPEPLPSPIEQLKLEGRRRRRASGSRTGPPEVGLKAWSWGEEVGGPD